MELVCINCPKGCHLIVEEVNNEIVVSGNTCPRGKEYAINELTNPLRTITTTVEIESILQNRLPVISSKPIPKALIMDAVKALKNVKVKTPIIMGDVIVHNICETGVDIIASKSIMK